MCVRVAVWLCIYCKFMSLRVRVFVCFVSRCTFSKEIVQRRGSSALLHLGTGPWTVSQVKVDPFIGED
jgi:hypothetical protein